MKPQSHWRRWPWEVIILTLAALATRTWQLARPDATVFDEVYFKDFASRYFTGHYYFDIHPPLGKLLLAGWAHLVGIGAGGLTQTPAWTVRFLPAVAGALLVPLVYGIMRRLGQRRLIATLAAAAVLLDNALVTESRFILTDSLLLLFGFGAVYAALAATQSKRALTWWVMAGLLGGAAASTKWTGLASLGLVGLIWIGQFAARRPKRWRLELLALVIVPCALYLGVFWLHFRLLPQSGTGDPFMSIKFQQTLQGSPYYQPRARDSFWDKFIELNHEMYEASATLTASHPYASPWYKWPLEIRPIYYWEGPTLANGTQGNIYLLGNPFVWWPAAMGLTIAAFSLILPSLKTTLSQHRAALSLLVVGYLANFLPFTTIKRVMFLYHYLFALIFSLMIGAIILGVLLPRVKAGTAWYRRPDYLIVGGLLAVILIGFVFFAPLTYGTPLSPAAFQAREWLRSWR